MAKFKTQPICKDPNWKYRSSVDTDIRRTFARVRKTMAAPTVVKETLVVNDVRSAANPGNITELRFAREARK